MVYVMVHIHPLDTQSEKCLERFEVVPSTYIHQLKNMVAESIKGAPPATDQELVFLGEWCDDQLQLKDYGICHEWIKWVTGFVVNPPYPGKKFIDGVLVPLDTPEPDYDVYDV